MKITTELKNLIKRSFDEKRAEIRKLSAKEAQIAYEKMVINFEKSKEFKAYAKAANNLYEAFEEFKTQNSYGNDCNPWNLNRDFCSLRNATAKIFVSDNVFVYSRYNKNIMKAIRDKINELDLAQESLLIKLTYEKDIENIRNTLAEYNIVI